MMMGKKQEQIHLNIVQRLMSGKSIRLPLSRKMVRNSSLQDENYVRFIGCAIKNWANFKRKCQIVKKALNNGKNTIVQNNMYYRKAQNNYKMAYTKQRKSLWNGVLK